MRRLETPRQALAVWRLRDVVLVALACLLVALLSSWPALVEPNLRPGVPAPFSVRAPKAATVIDSEALEQRRSQLVPHTQVQVVDPGASKELSQRLESRFQELERLARSPEERLAPLNLSPSERLWLQGRSPEERLLWEAELRRAQELMLQQGLNASVAEEQLQQAAALHLAALPQTSRQLGSRLLADVLQGRTNLRIDPRRTQSRIESLITQQGFPHINVRRDDLITRQGEPISSQAFDVLDYFGLVNRSPQPLAWLVRFLEALLAAVVLVLVSRRWRASLEARHALLALVALLLVQGFKLWLGGAASPLALLVPPTLLLAQGLGTPAGLAWLAAASLLWPLPIDGLMEVRLLVAAAVAAVAAVAAGRQRNRAQLLQLAVLLPSAALVIQWLLLQWAGFGAAADTPWATVGSLLSEALLMGGLLMGGLLLAPLVESFFGLLTRARLLELADLERPLLRRLSCEAPGTFEHTLMICGLAEEGARAIHADVDLTRTGALYHDVGKLHGPEWFIENQGEGANPHDQLNDPFASAAILQAHVDEGLQLARRYRLPRPLADFIPEHQGTLKMGYFLHQARERDAAIPEARFRYEGPTPRSRETGILMLADGCEAALRSLPPNTSEAEARAMVHRLVEARQRDGQLAASGITRAELELIIRAFVRVWRRMRHRRIPYPISPRKAFSA
ncbi:MAG: HDIG domain-containing protein [Prochlorococcaceae cyanobacterium]